MKFECILIATQAPISTEVSHMRVPDSRLPRQGCSSGAVERLDETG
jgi:hypothetical protein